MSLTKQEFNDLVAKAGAGLLSDEEAAALEPYRVRNAIILAAGTCRRFAPISFDYPKPLVVVRGEVLIERQIRQLLSVGIADITIVVGHMKEMFAYLVEKYGVKLVESPEYILSNNLVSLYHVRESLGGTYILSGDQFYTVNPFERYVYRSFYATTLTMSDDEWIMETNPEGVVTDMALREDGGEKLQGPCYVDGACGAALAAALEAAYEDKENRTKYWEYAWYLHRDTVNIATRFYPQGVLNAFKTMDDLYAFDDSYLLHVRSQALKNICDYLGCAPEELHDFEPLLAGLTNFSVVFTVGDTRYVYRHPVGFGPIEFDRAIETIANKAAFEAGVDRTFIHEDPETGWKLCHFVENARNIEPTNTDEAQEAAALLGQFQRNTQGITVDKTFSRWDLCLYYEEQVAARNFAIDEHTLSYRDRVVKLAECAAADNFPLVLSHNDCWCANYIKGEDGTLDLIDWEYAAMADWLSDICNLINSYFSDVPSDDRDFIRRTLRSFLGREETPEEWRHLMALSMITCWKNAMWVVDYFSSSFTATDWPIEAWLSACWEYFDAQLDYSVSLYEE